MNWDLSVFYKGFDDEAFKRDLGTLTERCHAFRDHIAQGASLESLVGELESLARTVDRLAYIYLTLACDASHPQANASMNQYMLASMELEQASNAFSRHLAALPDLEAQIAGSEMLSARAFALRDACTSAQHMLPESLESWMLRLSISGGEAFSQLRDKLDATLLVDYRGEQLPLSAVRAKAYDADPDVRREAYEAEIKSYDKVSLPMSYCLNSIKAEARTMSEAMGYSSVLERTLAQSRLSRKTLDAMFAAINEALPAFRKYLRHKAEMLGHKDGLPFYDLFAPLGSVTRTYTVAEARGLLVREMGKFSPAMGQFIDHAFENNWIDMFPRPGKSGGAFCSPNHEMGISRIMTNFAGSLSDVSTLAHELGHAWNEECMKGLPSMMTSTPMPLAETASIFNETLLSHILKQSASREELITLLDGDLAESTQTIVDITSRYLFENAVVDADHPLSVEELCAAMLDAQDKTYGEGLDKNVRHPYMWACKSHYYSPGLNFYNFPYAFGCLFGTGLFMRYLKEGEAFVPVYNQLLRSFGSGTIEEVAASVGLDVTDVAFWRDSLQCITDEIEEFVKL